MPNATIEPAITLLTRANGTFAPKFGCVIRGGDYALHGPVRGSSSVGRAQASQAWGRGFESHFPLEYSYCFDSMVAPRSSRINLAMSRGNSAENSRGAPVSGCSNPRHSA